jgi:glycerophosphoryl diester phosphodiesterase
VHVWTVNDAATARALWARGVAGIVTDLPETIRAVRP